MAERLKNKKHCFVLGKGYAEPVAMEGALKLKEMAYLHAEGYSGGALKHGPFALLEVSYQPMSSNFQAIAGLSTLVGIEVTRGREDGLPAC